MKDSLFIWVNTHYFRKRGIFLVKNFYLCYFISEDETPKKYKANKAFDFMKLIEVSKETDANLNPTKASGID